MADQLRPSAPRLSAAELTRLARQNAATARAARAAGAPGVAEACDRAAAYYRGRRAALPRAARGRGRAA